MRCENRLPAWPSIVCGMVFGYPVRRIIDGVTPMTLDDQVAFVVIGFLAIAAASLYVMGCRRMIRSRNLAEAKVARGEHAWGSPARRSRRTADENNQRAGRVPGP